MDSKKSNKIIVSAVELATIERTETWLREAAQAGDATPSMREALAIIQDMIMDLEVKQEVGAR